MLSASDLEYMRGAIEQLFPDTCYILSATSASDGQGGYTETWGTAGTSICRIDAAASKGGFIGQFDTITAGAIQESTKWMVSLPHDTTVTLNNRVKINTYEYNIVAADLGKSWNGEVRLVVERI